MTTPKETQQLGLHAANSNSDQEGTRNFVNRPIIMPDAYNGETGTRWDQWIAHFDSVAQVNGWDRPTRLLWLQVRLTGKAQTAWERLDQSAKLTYDTAIAALRERFEPSSKRDLYVAEFQTRKRLERESWGDLADSLHSLADRAFPDLEDKAREQLSLNRFLSLIANPTVALAVRQRHPKDLNEAVTYTLEAETYLSLTPAHAASITVASHSEDSGSGARREENNAAIAAIQVRQDAVMELLKSLTTRMERIERMISQQAGYNRTLPPSQPPTARSGNQPTSSETTIICRKCGKEGHFARGCAASYTSQRKSPGN